MGQVLGKDHYNAKKIVVAAQCGITYQVRQKLKLYAHTHALDDPPAPATSSIGQYHFSQAAETKQTVKTHYTINIE